MLESATLGLQSSHMWTYEKDSISFHSRILRYVSRKIKKDILSHKYVINTANKINNNFLLTSNTQNTHSNFLAGLLYFSHKEWLDICHTLFFIHLQPVHMSQLLLSSKVQLNLWGAFTHQSLAQLDISSQMLPTHFVHWTLFTAFVGILYLVLNLYFYSIVNLSMSQFFHL